MTVPVVAPGWLDYYQQQAARHVHGDDPTRCRACRERWPCSYRQEATAGIDAAGATLRTLR